MKDNKMTAHEPPRMPGPLSLERMIALPLAPAEFAGVGRMVLDLGTKARLYICEATSSIALDVLLEAWGSGGPTTSSRTPGEWIVASPAAARFANLDTDLVPMVCFLERHAGKMRFAFAGCATSSYDRLFVWPHDHAPRKMAGPSTFTQSELLARRLSEGFVPPAPVPVDEGLVRLIGG